MQRPVFDKRHQLLISFGYAGERFRGLAPQPDFPTAGGSLAERFRAAGVVPKALAFTARTDAGVHARHNIATCWLKDEPNPEAIKAAVAQSRNDGLHSVRLFSVDKHVHARGVARGKHYRYVIEMGCAVGAEGSVVPAPPHEARWRVAPWLDPEAMDRAGRYLEGEHDFTSFCFRRGKQQSTLREIYTVRVRAEGERQIVIDIHGRSFLRQMVRILSGTLAQVGAGLRQPHHMADILAARHRSAAGPTAPAQGLTLMRIDLPPELEATLAQAG